MSLASGFQINDLERVMELRNFFLDQPERETTTNRKTLERVPRGGKYSWKSHERSMEMGYLATSVASMPAWISMMIETDELNLDKPESQRFRQQPQNSTVGLLKLSDDSKAAAQAALKNTNEGHLGRHGNLSSEARQGPQ